MLRRIADSLFWAARYLERAEWRLPPERMKMGEEHIVPLSAQALAVLRELQPITGWGALLFPGLYSPGCPYLTSRQNSGGMDALIAKSPLSPSCRTLISGNKTHTALNCQEFFSCG